MDRVRTELQKKLKIDFIKKVYNYRASGIIYNLILSNYNEDKYCIVPSNICPVVIMTLLKANKKIEFVDINLVDFNIDKEKTTQLVRNNPNKFDFLLYVRSYGNTNNEDIFFQTIKKINPNLIIIDDCCLSIPKFETEICNYSDINLYSTGYTKYVSLNEGAWAILDKSIEYKEYDLKYNPNDEKKMVAITKEALSKKNKIEYYNSNWLNNQEIDDIENYNKRVQVEFDRIKQIKIKLNNIYSSMLPKEIQLPTDYQNWRFNIFVSNKNYLLDLIFKNGYFASSHYPNVAFLINNNKFPNTELVHSKIINLFNNDLIKEEQAKAVAKLIVENL